MLAPVLQKYPEWMAYPGNTDYFGATAICLGHEPVQGIYHSFVTVIGRLDHSICLVYD